MKRMLKEDFKKKKDRKKKLKSNQYFTSVTYIY